MTSSTHFRTCNLCEAMCGLAIELVDGDIIAIRGDADDPFSQGHICPKAVALKDIYEDPDRLRAPVRRTPDGWETISWDEAFDAVVAGLRDVQARYGTQAVGVYQGNPNVHNVGTILYASGFVRALRTRNRFSATSVDQLPHHVAAGAMFGHSLLLPIPDIDRTDFLLILGANPLVSNGSLMSAPGVERRLKALQARGGRFVVVDPRRTATARRADHHHFIRPGADVFLLLAMVQTAFAEDLVAPGRLAAFTDGIRDMARLTTDFTPERVAAATGISAAAIRGLTRAFFTAPTAVCYARMGASTQAFGGLAQWLVNVLNVLSGNLDRPGGAMFTRPAIDVVAITGQLGATGNFGRWRSRVRGLPEYGGELPSATLAEEILTPGEGQIHALVTIAGNPVLSTPNGRQLDKALAGLEFMVAVDIYINETTRHADIILPPATGLETAHYDLVFHALAVRNTVKYSPPLFPPAPGVWQDWEIFRELRRRLGGVPDRPRRRQDIFARFELEPLLDIGLRFGPYGRWGPSPAPGAPGLTLRKVRQAPHGIDLGPLRPGLPERLYTPEKRIHLAPALMVADLERVEGALAVDPASDGLVLIGRRALRSNNSWMHNSARLVRGRDRCTLLIHPDDAGRRGIVDGQAVCVRSRVGEVQLTAEVTAAMMPGVVSMPHGWGHGRAGVRLRTAARRPGVSINDLTDDQAVDSLTGNAAFSGLPVTVRAAATP